LLTAKALFGSACQRSNDSTMSDVKEISRRNFCVHVCQAASGLALGSMSGACGGGGSGPSNVPQLSVINGSVSGSTMVVQIDSASPLAAVGSAAMVRGSGGSFLVARTAQETFAALTSTCTHEDCTITGFDNTNYVCPCHGSRFTTSGGVINGPANARLRTFATQFSNNVLTISI
jgi:cytochrome b6-f complex iron-sulfur subunit